VILAILTIDRVASFQIKQNKLKICPFFSQEENVEDDVQLALMKIRDHKLSDISDAKMKELKKRKLIKTQ